MTERSKAESVGVNQEKSTARTEAPVSKLIARGWFWPENSRKAHYFTTHGGYPRSLCGGWALFASMTTALEDNGHTSPDNCAKCKLKWVSAYAPEDDG